MRRYRLIELPSRILPPPGLEFRHRIQAITIVVMSSIDCNEYAFHAANNSQAAENFILFVAVDGVETPGPSTKPYCKIGTD